MPSPLDYGIISILATWVQARTVAPGGKKKAPGVRARVFSTDPGALPKRCTTRAKPHPRSLNLKVGNLEYQDAQVWSRAHPLRPTRTVSSHFREGFRSIFRALWRRGREVCSPASRQGILPRASGGAWRIFFRCESACARARSGEVCSPATCEAFFGSAARSAAQRRAKFSSERAGGRGRGGARSAARQGVPRVGVDEGAAACRSTTRRRGDVSLGACRRRRRLGGLNSLQVRSLASWRCVPRRVSAWAKAWWPGALSTSGGLGRNWAAQWHLARAVGKRFRGCRAKRLYARWN